MAAATPQTSQVERSDEGLILRGRLDGASVGRLWSEASRAAAEFGGGTLVVDASGVDYCDGAGAALLIALRQNRERAGGAYELRGLRDQLRTIVAMAEPSAEAAAPEPPRRENPFEALGRSTFQAFADLRTMVEYVGQLTLALASAVRHPRQVRGKDMMLVAEQAGIGAVPIVALIGFLLGLILSFQSAVPMRQFGAEIFVADLLGISLLRELGPLMAAVMLTARSGSAFAAEIGTMKVNEEVDALSTMGLEPMRFLILPRVVAAVLVVPVLAMVMNAAGLFGGALMFLSLDFPLVTYVNRITDAVRLADFVGGIFKALIFGIIVAAVGCQKGLGTGKGAGAVGLSTTSSVVTGITLIAIVDGIFAVLFYVLGI